MNTNPLKQYFRRPALYLKLPSGGNFYPEGSIELSENKEIPIYPMTAIDEITSKTPDGLYNGVAVAEIIKSCAPNIKDPWSIPVLDLDAILIAIRAATSGGNMDIESSCPACKEDASYGINLTGLLNNLGTGDYSNNMKIDDLTFKFTPLTYKKVNSMNLVQFEIERSIRTLDNITNDDERLKISSDAMKKLNSLSMQLVTEAIEYIATPSAMVTEKEHIMEFLLNCDKNTYDTLKSTAVKYRESAQMKPLKIKCIHCQHEYEQTLTLNVSDFFE